MSRPDTDLRIYRCGWLQQVFWPWLGSRLGAWLGNWNDRTFAGDTSSSARWIWHCLDDVAHRLYVMRE